jgi:SP family arabinose:H+ symporter-like MFS transporter
MYIAEIAPSRLRGRLVTLYQLAIVSGLLLAYLSNYLLLNTGVNNWRWMFSSQTIPSLLFLAGLLFVPESPDGLSKKIS